MNAWQQNHQGQTPPNTPRQRRGNQGTMMPLVDAGTVVPPAQPVPSHGSFTINVKVPGQD